MDLERLGKMSSNRAGYNTAAKALQKVYGTGNFSWVKEQAQKEEEEKEKKKLEEEAKRYEETQKKQKENGLLESALSGAGEVLDGAIKGGQRGLGGLVNSISTGFDSEETKKKNEELDKELGINNLSGAGQAAATVASIISGLPAGMAQAVGETGRNLFDVSKDTTVQGLSAADRNSRNAKLREMTARADADPSLWDNKEFTDELRSYAQETNERLSKANEYLRNSDTAKKDKTEVGARAAEAVVDLATFGGSSAFKELGEQGVKSAAKAIGKEGTESILTREILGKVAKDGTAKSLLGRTASNAATGAIEGSVGGALGAVGDKGDEATVQDLIQGGLQGAAMGAVFSAGKGAFDKLSGADEKTMTKAVAQDEPDAIKTIKDRFEVDDANAKQMLDDYKTELSTDAKLEAKKIETPDSVIDEYINQLDNDNPALQVARDKTEEFINTYDEVNKLESADPEFLRANNLTNDDLGRRLAYNDVLQQDEQLGETVADLSDHVATAESAIEQLNNEKMNYAYSIEKDALDQKYDDMIMDARMNGVDVDISALQEEYDAANTLLQAKYPDQVETVMQLDQALEGATRNNFEASAKLDEIQRGITDQVDKRYTQYSIPDYTKVDEAISTRKSRLEEINKEVEQAEKRVNTQPTSVRDADDRIAVAQSGEAPELKTKSGEIDQQKTGSYLTKTKEEKTQIETKQANKKLSEGDELELSDRQKIIADEAAKVSWKKRDSVLQLFESPEKKLKAIGAEELAESLDQSTVKTSYGIHTDIQELKKNGIDKLSKTDNTKVVRALEGDLDASDLTSKQRKAYEFSKNWFENWADKLGLEKDQRIENYFAHILPKDKNGKQYIPDELSPSVKKLFKGDVRAGNIDNSRLANNQNYDLNVFDVMKSYSAQANKKAYLEPALKDIELAMRSTADMKFANYLNDLGSFTRGDTQAIDKIMNDATGGVYGKALDAYRNANYGANLGGNTRSMVQNLTQGVNTVSSTGTKNYLVGLGNANKALVEYASGNSNKFDTYHKYGILEGMTLSEGKKVSSLKGIQNKITGVSMAPFQATEQFNRITAFEAGVSKFKNRFSEKYWDNPDLLDNAKMTAKSKAEYRKLIARSDNYEDAMNKYGANIAKETQFKFSEADTPPILRSKTGKTILQYKGSVIKSMEYVASVFGGTGKEWYDAYKSGEISLRDLQNTAKAARYVAATSALTTVTSSLMGQGIENFFPNPIEVFTEGSPFVTLFTGDQYGTTGLAQVLSGSEDVYDDDGNEITGLAKNMELLKQFGTENFLPGVIPGYNQARRIEQTNDAIDTGVATSRNGNAKFTVGEDERLQSYLFGVSNTKGGREYTENEQMPLSSTDSEKVLSAPKEQRDEYYEFYRAAENITGKQEWRDKISKTYNDGQVEKAKRYAKEFNDQVSEKMAPYYSKYPNMASQLEDELNNKLYIKPKYLYK